jgi:quinol monooxygenase YgiN
MADKITLGVHFHMEESAKQEFVAKMRDIFANIVNEETFVEASLVQDMRDPQSILNYEVWNDGPQSFMKNQMSKDIRAEFEKMIVDLKIDRLQRGIPPSQSGKEAESLERTITDAREVM